MAQMATLSEQAKKLEEAHARVLAALRAYVECDRKDGVDGTLRSEGERALAFAEKVA